MRLDELLQREERRLQDGLRQGNESSSPGVAKKNLRLLPR